MKTLIVLTFGANELPCLIAGRRLFEIYHARDGAEPAFLAIYSNQVVKEMDRVKAELERWLFGGNWFPEDQWRQAEVDAYDPNSVFTVATGAFDAVLKKSKPEVVHLHHTGGTAAMGVHTFEALVNSPGRRECRVETSYLDARHRRLKSRDLSGFPSDERNHWSLTLEDLARLHGYFIEFEHEDHKRGYVKIVNEQPDPALAELGERMTLFLTRGKDIGYGDWLKPNWEKRWRRTFPRFPDPSVWPERIPWFRPPKASEEFQQISQRLNRLFPVWDNDLTTLYPSRLREEPDKMRRLHQFLCNGFLELHAYRQLATALAELRPKGTPPVYHSVHFARGPRVRRDFEIDVLTVLGYEPLVISCCMSMDPKDSKVKAMEVFHRCRQLGGDQARGGVVSLVTPSDAEDLVGDLELETGVRNRPVKIWNITELPHLKRAFTNYLSTDLRWSKL